MDARAIGWIANIIALRQRADVVDQLPRRRILGGQLDEHRITLVHQGREKLADRTEALIVVVRQSNHDLSPEGVVVGSWGVGAGVGCGCARTIARARAIASGTVSVASSAIHAARSSGVSRAISWPARACSCGVSPCHTFRTCALRAAVASSCVGELATGPVAISAGAAPGDTSRVGAAPAGADAAGEATVLTVELSALAGSGRTTGASAALVASV